MTNRTINPRYIAHAQLINFKHALTFEKEYLSKNKIPSNFVWRITESGYDKFFTNLNEQSVDIDTRLSMLQEAQDNYFITANYILELTQKAYKLFLSSEIEERRQLLKLVFSNLTMKGKKVQFEAQKPFDTILSFADSPSWGG